MYIQIYWLKYFVKNKTCIGKTEIPNNVQEQASFTLLLLVTKILNLENVPET